MLGVYPEGGVYAGPGIGPMRSGVRTRPALEGSLTGAISGLQVVPIGIEYEQFDEPGTDVLAVIGAPLQLDDWLEDAPDRRNVAFTMELRRMLETVSRTAVTVAEAADRDRILAAAGASIAEEGEPPIVAAGRIRRAWTGLHGDPIARAAAENICEGAERAAGSRFRHATAAA